MTGRPACQGAAAAGAQQASTPTQITATLRNRGRHYRVLHHPPSAERLLRRGRDAERVVGRGDLLGEEDVDVDVLADTPPSEGDALELRPGVGREAEQVALCR